MSCCQGCCRRPGLGIIPILFSATVALTCITTYAISVGNGHVYPYFPTISDTGGQKPESNIFGLFLGGGSFIGVIVVIIRFAQFRHEYEYNEVQRPGPVLVNKLALLIGVLACLGALLVSTFQDRGKSLIGHEIGALIVFGGGILYSLLQTYLTYKMMRCAMNTKRMVWIRITLSCFGLIFLLSFLILFRLALMNWRGTHQNGHGYALWQPGDGGYTFRVLSSASEWLCAASLLLYFISFSGEFNKLSLDITLRRHQGTFLFQNSVEEHRRIMYA